MDDLTKKLMRECEASKLPLQEQAMALGAAYASYLMAKDIPASEIRDFLDRAIGVIEDVKREQSGWRVAVN